MMLLVGANKVKKILKYSIIIAVIELVLLFTIVPKFGAIGLIIMLYLITPTLIYLLMHRAARRLLGVKLNIYRIIKVVVAGAISAAFLVPLIIFSTNYILILLVGVLEQIVLYPVIIAITGAAKINDLEDLKRITEALPLISNIIVVFAEYSKRFARN